MIRQNTIKVGFLVAASFMLFASDPSALAQSLLQTPSGRQTVAPSDMPQQPTLNEDFANPSKMNSRTIPPAGPDMPGVPGIEPPGRKATTGPGMIQNGSGEMSAPLRMKTSNDAIGTVETPRTGGIVLPEGIPSSVRIGPMEPVPMWQRAALGFWLALQLVVLCVVATAMHFVKARHDDEYQGGHMINRDHTEPLARRGNPIDNSI